MRIIAGKFKGLKLDSFEMENIRPTSDKVREAVFNKIQFEILNSTVLDLFCGTGAISLEFLSRGAKTVITADNNMYSIELTKRNFKKAKQNINVFYADYKKALKNVKDRKFDFIYIDPPYDTDYGEQAIFKINELNLLNENGTIIYEHFFNKVYSIPDNFEITDRKKYGTQMITYIKVKEDAKGN